MANHKAEDPRTVLVGFKANQRDLQVLKAAKEKTGLSTQAEVIRWAVRQQFPELYAEQRAAQPMTSPKSQK